MVRLLNTKIEGGCAAKLNPKLLHNLIDSLNDLKTPDCLLSSLKHSEDASVYQITEDIAIIESVDFFPPIIDDPYIYGQIAACNALSDIYAMGGEPITALNILAFPTCDYDLSIAKEILAGGLAIVNQSGASLTGGHSIQSASLIYGLCVTGLVNPRSIWKMSGAKEASNIVLTKNIGTGIGVLGLKANLLSSTFKDNLLNSLTTLNKQAKQIASKYDPLAATDITGYGLIGHLHNLALASGLKLTIDAAKINYFDEALELSKQGFLGTQVYANKQAYGNIVMFSKNLDLSYQDLMFDPQTSGGLALVVRPKDVDLLVNDLTRFNIAASCIGEFSTGTAGLIEVVYND